jgi:hypothetical protein
LIATENPDLPSRATPEIVGQSVRFSFLDRTVSFHVVVSSRSPISRAAMKFPSPTRSRLAIVLLLALSAAVSAAEIRVIEPDDDPGISGKEVDWIYGDYLMKNDQIALAIAAPLATRDANMTIRNIGGSILDLTLNHPSNDQLSVLTSQRREDTCFMILLW